MKKDKNLKVLILIGLPASGKSTYAKSFIEKRKQLFEDWVIVSRDGFRSMLKNQPICEPKIEALITEMQNEAIISALNLKCNVVIDNTNLKVSVVEKLCDLVKHYADVEFMLFDVPGKECIQRDSKREKSVGEAVIKRMQNSYETFAQNFNFQNRTKQPRLYQQPEINKDLKGCYIFDIDGTLAHMNGKRTAFEYDKVLLDSVDLAVRGILTILSAFHVFDIIIVSGREEGCREETEMWLSENNIQYSHFYMRRVGDYRKDTIVKKEIYDTHIKPNYNVFGVFDDRVSVCEMWREQGLTVFQLQNNKY